MLAEGYGGALPPTAVDYVAAVLDSVARLGVLIDNVLDLTQSDTGSLLLAEDEVDLAALCAEEAATARALAKKAKIVLADEILPSVGIVTGDPRRLSQALGNVVKNAISYTGKSGRVLLRAEGDRDEARIIVSDNGRGIAPADQARVFDRFSRTAETRTGEEAAIGLGLPLAKQFVEAHGGAIELVSKPGEGTTVTIRLPRTAEQRADWPIAQVAE
jgi:signal transduction histidine kinase